MDHRTARWMQLKRIKPTEVEKFHALERSVKVEHGIVTNKAGQTSAPALVYLTRLNAMLGPYWDRAKLEEDRAREVSGFERHIYMLWAPILQPSNPKYSTDLEALHAADLAIIRDDYVINRHAGGPQVSSRIGVVYGNGASA